MRSCFLFDKLKEGFDKLWERNVMGVFLGSEKRDKSKVKSGMGDGGEESDGRWDQCVCFSAPKSPYPTMSQASTWCCWWWSIKS